MEYIIGVDGGGTKTIAVIADIYGNILGLGISEGSNYHTVGLENAIKAIENSLKKAILQAQLYTNKIKYACFGLAGSGRQTDYNILFSALKGLMSSENFLLKHDAQIALAGATICQTGIIVIAGTGTMAFGIEQSGREERSSGWGYLIGDEGSAYYIGHQALSSACKAFDGRGKYTLLLGGIMNYLGLNDFTDIIKKIYKEKISTQDIASIAQIVSQYAKIGDEIAIEILKDSAFELALSAISVIKKLDIGNDNPLIAVSGSVFNAGDLILKDFEKFIKSSYPSAKIIRPYFKPVVGALLLSYKSLEVEIDEDLIDNLKKGDYIIEKGYNVKIGSYGE